MMLPISQINLIAAVTLASICLTSYAQEITAINIDQAKARIGLPVNVQVQFNLRESPNPYCGIEINFGDGETHKGRPGYNGAQDFPYNVSHSYRNAGTYVVKVAGIYVSRGLRSAVACTGDAKQISVVVVDPLADKAAEEVDRKAQELAAKELELRRLSEKLESERRSLERKEQEQQAQRRTVEVRDKKPTETVVPQRPQTVSSPKTTIDPF